jgi:hypothetical protein
MFFYFIFSRLQIDLTPRRYTLCRIGITTRQQYRQLVRLESAGQSRGTFGPAWEASFGKPLLAKPKPLPVIHQYFDGSCPAIAKNK